MKNKKMLATILCLASLATLIAMTPGLSGAQTPLQTQTMGQIRTQNPPCLQTPTMDRLQTQTRTQATAPTQTQIQQQIQAPAVSQTGIMIQQRDRDRIHVPVGTPKR